MALRISGDSITSDRSAHTARLASGARHLWEVSWLPGRHLDRNKAITAMTVADTTVDGKAFLVREQWQHVQDWATELSLSSDQVAFRVAEPPQWARHPDKTHELPAPNPPGVEEPGPSQTDPGWRDNGFFEFVRDEEPDWAWDAWPDPDSQLDWEAGQ